jgi:hypothetical protein
MTSSVGEAEGAGKRHPLIYVLIGVALLLLLAVTASLSHRSHSQTALQAYKTQLRAKGEKLTFAELGITTSAANQQAFAVFTKVAGKLGRAGADHPSMLDWMKFSAPGKVCVAQTADQPPMYGNGTTNIVGWPAFISRIDAAEPDLEKLRELLSDPAPDRGLGTNIFASPLMPVFLAMRTGAQWLAGATLKELHEANLEKALANLHALMNLARLNREEYILGSLMVRVAIARLAVVVTWETLQAPGWTDAQLERLQIHWEQLELLDGLEGGLVGERAYGQELSNLARSVSRRKATQILLSRKSPLTAGSVLDDCLLTPASRLIGAEEDNELSHLRTTQSALEIIRNFRAGDSSWKQASDSLQKISDGIGPINRLRYGVSLMSLPNLGAADTVVRVETERHLALATIVLKRFELRHGEFPASLEALVPDFIASVPIDPMSGRPLKYRLLENHHFLLYSVGEDGRDNGGNATPVSSLSFGLWNSPDAVWPAPAEDKPAKPMTNP